MTKEPAAAGGKRNWWRIIGWGTAVFLLVLPFIAMQLSAPGVNWSPGDFIFAALMFGMVGLLLELVARASQDWNYRGGVALAVFAGFVLIWSNAAVGILGDEDNPANLLFLAVPAVALAGGMVTGFRARGMVWAMTAAGVVLLAVPAFAYAFAIGDAASLTHFDYPVFLALYALMWFGSAALFRRAARGD